MLTYKIEELHRRVRTDADDVGIAVGRGEGLQINSEGLAGLCNCHEKQIMHFAR